MIELISGNLDNESTFPDWKDGVYFVGLTKKITCFTYSYFKDNNYIYTKKENRFIRYDRVTAFRWEFEDSLNKIELMLVDPEIVKNKNKIAKELI